MELSLASPPETRTALDPVDRAGAPDAGTLKAAQDFEAVFLSTVLNEMLDSAMPKTMGGGIGEQMFNSFLGNELARTIAESGGLGLARSVEAQLEAYRR